MEIYDELRDTEWIFDKGPVSIEIEVGFSSRASDLDNVFKPLLDTLQHIYENFNDNKVYQIQATKFIVPKGSEFIRLRVTETTEPEAQCQTQEATTS